MSGRDRVRPLLIGLGWSPDQTGGLNRYLGELLRALPEAEAVVVGPARHPPPRVTAVSDHAAPLPARLRAVARAARRAAPGVDVVDAHFALYAALPTRRGPLRRVPVVVHFHGPWAEEATAAGARGRLRHAARTAVERSVYRRAERAVTLSGAFARLLIECYRVVPWRVEIVAPGVDRERFAPGDAAVARAAIGVDPGAQLVLAVRRLVPRTGVDVLLDAWSGLDHTGRVLMIAGDGPEHARLAEQARRLGLTGVQLLGEVPDGDLPHLYQAADVCVVPSVALEGFGLVVLEALACGTPVITTDVGGLPETVAGLDPGLVVPAGDARALRQRLAGALDGTNPVPDAERCRAHAETFDWRAVADRHRQIYADALVPPRRLRVLFVDHCARLSGAEIAMLRLAKALHDVDVHVALFERGPLLTSLGAAGITSEVVSMPARTRELSRERVGATVPWRALLDTAVHVVRLARRIRQLRPDVVHANSLKACLVAGLAARLAHVPCVWHVRDRINDDTFPRPAVRFVRVLAARLPTAVVANSESTLESLHLSPDRGPVCTVIGDPLPPEFLARAPAHPRDTGDLVVGIVGRLAPWKGQHVFLEAFSSAFPAGGATARVVGDALFGEDTYAETLRVRATELGIAPRVEFRGFRHDIAAELAELDVLVHASVPVEPFGQVVVEGMAIGLPVVATDGGGPAEIINSGIDGILVAPGDVGALADALRTLAADSGYRRRLGTAARAGASRFRADRIAPRFVEVYREMVQPR